ncbi:hypothetical protein DFA_01110 [Cavenderia fasciculata]|uniref:Uncharacterized protein n=1 Tax=Cavenderia fasciculata TaxID=261658 RepID=F4PQX0_CACFS|nr:uncharacterized protein DFA_01110 [Cavenderia fasciculata]EGG21235.1 hypothetical protein DFA_01110 [Cavenderia fasciculata]|eukprot:XP_004359085.1 hypothetical protein DFA_01110 [Cavenderia fasciculata]
MKNGSNADTTNTNSWVLIETFNEEGCDLDSSSIGGTIVLSGSCVIGQQVSCNNNIITVEQFKDNQCQTTITNTTEYKSGVCNTASQIYGFYKTYTCSSSEPSIPPRSLSYNTYTTCDNTTMQIQVSKWVPTYKCMVVGRGSIPTSGSSSASSGHSSSASSGNPLTGSGSGSSGSASSGYASYDNFDGKKSTLDFLDRYFEFLDEINFGNPSLVVTDDDDDVDDQGVGVIFDSGTATDGAYSGSGSGTGSGSGPTNVNVVVFGLLLCNEKYNENYNYYNGNFQTTSGPAGSVMSTGKYSSGDPYGSQMLTGGGTISGSGGSGSSSQNGCSIKPSSSGSGPNFQQCTQYNQLFAVTCTPPYSHA